MSLREAMCRWSLAQRVVNVVVGGLAMVGCSGGAPVELSASVASSSAAAAAASTAASSPGVGTKTEQVAGQPDCDPAKKNSDGTPKRAPPGPPGRPPETLVLAYDDFGPQASAFTLLGFEWWAWEGGGSWETCDSFEIRVVVFRGVQREAVEKAFPTAKSKADLVERGLADYRYVEHRAALAHLDGELAEIAGVAELTRMAETLRATRHRIVEQLGP